MGSTSTTWTIEELCGMTREEHIAMFLELPAPAPDFAGEFQGTTPDYLARLFADSADADGLGPWFGKAFVPEQFGEFHGHGYNIWTPHGTTRRDIRFAWGFADSILDGKPCAFVRYGAFENVYSRIDLRDELRYLGDGIYLGIAHSDGPTAVCPWPGGADGRSLPTSFMLRGPVAAASGPDNPRGELRAG